MIYAKKGVMGEACIYEAGSVTLPVCPRQCDANSDCRHKCWEVFGPAYKEMTYTVGTFNKALSCRKGEA